MNGSVRRTIFILALAANVVLVLLTVLAYYQDWDNAYWPIFLVWAAVPLTLVVVAFLSRRPNLAPSSSSSHHSGGPADE